MDLKITGEKLRNIRSRLNMTQEQVARRAYISRRTLMRIEKGEVAPSFENIATLSGVYKVDLFYEFSKLYKYYNEKIFKEIDAIEYKLQDMDYNALKENLDNLEPCIILSSLVEQYFYIIKGFYYLNSKAFDIKLSYDYLIKGLSLHNKNFNLENYKDFKYSPIELRALTAITSILSYQGDNLKSLEILEFSYNNNTEISISYYVINISYAASLTIRGQFDKSLKVIDKTIDSANKNNFQTYLPFLYYSKYLNYKRLNNKSNAIENLNTGLLLCDVYKKFNLKNLIKNIRKKYV